jgi:hypothetical protein
VSGHTPGPWEFEPERWSESGSYRQPNVVANGVTIATVRVGTGCDEGNARLLAAAPALLEAAKAAYSWLSAAGYDDVIATGDLAAAINKAEGR